MGTPQIAAAVAKTANKAGLSMVIVGDRVEARRGNKVVAFHVDAGQALRKALEREPVSNQLAEEVAAEPLAVEPPRVIKPKRPVHPAVDGAAVAAALMPAMSHPLPDAALVVVGTPPAPVKTSIIRDKYKARYKANGGSCGDLISEELRAYLTYVDKGRARTDVAKLKEVAVKNECWKPDYDKLNVGQQRMTVGNRLRARYAEGLQVDIGGCVFVEEYE